MTVADFPDFATPQAHATAISTTGTPLLHGWDQVATIGPVNIGANATGSTVVALAKPGYLLSIRAAFQTTNGLSPFYGIRLFWLDGGGNTIKQENWYGITANNGAAIPVYGLGPAKSNSVRIQYLNFATAQNVTFTITVFETTQHIDRDDFRGLCPFGLMTAPTGFNNPAGADGDAFANVLAQGAIAVAANSINDVFLPTFAGQVFFTAVNVANPLVAAPNAYTPGVNSPGPFNNGQVVSVAAGAGANGTMICTRGINFLRLTNNGAAASTISYFAVPVEYAS